MKKLLVQFGQLFLRSHTLSCKVVAMLTFCEQPFNCDVQLVSDSYDGHSEEGEHQKRCRA